jgi:diguanylate cyclase (GGDEF)-like protein/PAS domain S-box-containing protein
MPGDDVVGAVGAAPPALLVVNDDDHQRIAIRAMLASLDLVIVEADSGREAVRAVSDQTFALILMDVRMPGMDGYEAANLIRQQRESKRTPIIFLTAFGAEDHRESLVGYASGAIDFIHTPVIADVLRAKVSAFVDLFLQAEELQRSLDSITALNVALHESEASTRAVLDTVADGIVTVSDAGLIESINPSAEALFGYSASEAAGQPLTLMIAPALRDQFRGLSSRAPDLSLATTALDRAVETVGHRRDGSNFAMEIVYGIITRAGESFALALVRDISQRKAYTDSLEHRLLHDGLTGLANRTLFDEHVLQAIAAAKRTDEPLAVLMMDLDGFKHVNDTLGHAHGDLLLEAVARRLLSVLRETDTIARLGGDEFAILPGGATSLSAAAAVAWKIQQACAAKFNLGTEVVQISASLGIALFPDHGHAETELLRRADTAMYIAKRSGSGQVVFDDSHETQAAQKLAQLTDLRQCLPGEELVLHYQPKIDLSTREVTGVEALLRWQHPDRGLLTPDRFMADVEQTALIEPVTRWVLQEALRQQRIWREQGVDLTMAVNIFAYSLRPSSDLPEILAQITDTWGSAPDRLTLELTEDALLATATGDILAQLHTMGERMSIDDFGTGSSSLANLQRQPISEIKIDRSFVTHLRSESDDAVIVRSTIDVAHNLGLTVVAEGVEDEAAADLLVAYGCDSAQGYLFGRPLPAPQFIKSLAGSKR